MLRRPPKIQAAALCIRAVHGGNINQNEVLLVRSLDSGRWILPKGWPMKGESLARAAAIEAWEEAGITGRINPDAIGTFRYDKRLRGGLEEPCEAHVFVLEVESEAGEYPEAGLRTRRWFAPQKAAQKVDDADLADLIRRFCE
ncbi:MAG: NUDIX hydrolase [Pseudorhodobacter sp.]